MKKKTFVPLHAPVMAGNEWKYMKDCLDTGWVSTAGAYVSRFEEMAAKALGVKHAVAVVNGTSALHLALRVVGVGPGDEVIVPTITFIATANAAAYLGALPRFADVDESHLGLDPDKLELWLEKNARVRSGVCRVKATGRRVAACVPMHVFGHPARVGRIVEVCRRFSIPVIEDAAESLGSSYRGRATGAFGALGILSFNGNKILTTGGGGMVVGDDAVLTGRAKHLSTQAKKDPSTYLHDEVGYNYRLPNVNAALGCAQMEQLDGFLAQKRLIAEEYRRGLSGAADVSLIWEPDGARSNFWLNTVRAATPKRAIQLRERLLGEGFEARPLWTPCHRQPMFEKLSTGALDAGDRAWRTCFNVPSSSNLPLKTAAAISRLLIKK